MVSFQGSVLGALLTLLGWDGTDFRNVKVDSSGHLQIDVLSNVLGGDQATETTLALVKAQIGALTAPASGSTNKLLTDSLTELQFIKSLRNALHTVDLDMLVGYVAKDIGGWKELEIDTGGRLVVAVTKTLLPTDAATETSLQGIEDQVKDTLLNIKGGLRDFTAIVGDGSNELIRSTAVPPGEIWHVTTISVTNLDSGGTSASFGTKEGGSTYYFYLSGATVEDQATSWQGELWLDEGNQVAVLCVGTTNLDNIQLVLWGRIISV